MMDKPRIFGIAIALSAVCLVVALLLTSVLFCAYDKAFYQNTYAELGIAEDIGIPVEDLILATDTLLDYCMDKRDDLAVTVSVDGDVRQAFNERETQHMMDVKKLAMGAVLVRNMLFVCFAVLFMAGALFNKRRFGYVFKPFIIGLISGVVLIGAVGLYAATDFGVFWTQFHRLFFTNDLWLLNPNTSLLVNMVPEAFFFKLVMRILLYFGIAIALCVTVCITGLVIHKRKDMEKE